MFHVLYRRSRSECRSLPIIASLRSQNVTVPSGLCSLREARKGSTLFFLHFAISQISYIQSSSLLPSNRNRSTFVHALVTSLGLLRTHPSTSHHLTVLRPFPASRLDLTSYHDRSYVDALLAAHPGPDPTSCKEFGLEDVIAAPIHTHTRPRAHTWNTGLPTVSRPRRIRPRNSRRITDCGTGTHGRQV